MTDPGVSSIAYLARTLWHLGYPEQAREKSYIALNLAQELAHPFTEAAALVYAARVHICRRAPRVARDLAGTAIALSNKHGFPHYIAMVSVLRGWSLAQQGEGEEGIAQIRRGLNVSQESRMQIARSYFLALLGEARGKVGQIEAGLGVVAEACFHQALDLARRQASRSLELRSAVSLSRLWRKQRKEEQARQLLGEIYGWFTDGLDAPDLIEAGTLLEEMSQGKTVFQAAGVRS